MIEVLLVVAPLTLAIGCIVYGSTLESPAGHPRRAVISRRAYNVRLTIALFCLVVGVLAALTLAALFALPELS